MQEPEIVIVVESGMVTAVATTKESLVYRVIDLDAYHQDPTMSDMEADATGIDIEEYTKEATLTKAYIGFDGLEG